MSDVVSVIITSRNEEKNIYNLLKSLKLQTYSNIEVTLVDNFSTDKTLEISKQFNINIIPHGKERSEQRNIGFTNCNGKYGLYLDADMILTPNLINSLVETIQVSKESGLYIKEKILGKSLFNLSRDFERQFYEESSIDAIRFFSIESFRKLGGFDENITGQEDWDFSQRYREKYKTKILEKFIDKKLIIENKEFYNQFIDLRKIKSECILHNEINLTLQQHISKKKYYLKTLNVYKKKYEKNKSFKDQFTFGGRLRTIYNSNNFFQLFLKPHLTLLFIIFKILIFFKIGLYKKYD